MFPAVEMEILNSSCSPALQPGVELEYTRQQHGDIEEAPIVFYALDESERIVFVLAIDDRKDAYR